MKVYRLINKHGKHIANINSTYVFKKDILLKLCELGYWIDVG
jgi:hypothetical protein